MKKQKAIESVWLAKTLSVILAVLILVAMYLVPTSAAELTTDGASASTVAHSVNAEFTASIPAYVMPGEPGEVSADYTVTLENAVIPDNHELTAKVEYSGSMTEQNGVELPYVLTDATGNTIASGTKILTKSAGAPGDSVSISFGAALTAKARYAGVYSDTATFTFDVAEKVYTIDEINADTHLYAIGKTKPEYVVAQFNEDYSEVTIFKNGDESDGWMRNWTFGSSTSPFCRNKSTVKTAIVKDGVANIGDNAFYLCQALRNVTISNSVTHIGNWAFDGCNFLTSVDIPEGVVSIGVRAFCSCSFTNILIPSSVTNIEDGAFYDCYPLKSIAVSTDNPAYSSEDGILFNKDRTEIVAYPQNRSGNSYGIPENVTSVRNYAFSLASQRLKTISIPDSVTYIGELAFYNTRFAAINVSESNPNYSSENGVLFNKEKSALIKYPGNKTDSSYAVPDGVTSIADYAFERCVRLESVSIAEGVTVLGKETFSGCKALTSVTIPESVSSICSDVIDGTFRNCNNLKTIFGVSGSYAETFAEQNGYTFIAQ